jgi:phage replication O-like protein O
MSHEDTGPQLEDGFTRIANELFDAILLFGFTSREVHVLLAIVRKTYGYGKKEDDMSASQIGDLCGLARPHVTATLNSLASRNVVTKKSGRFGSIIGIQKNHRKWLREILAESSSASTETVQGRTDSVLPKCSKIQQTASTDSVHGRTDLVHVPIQYVDSTESVQVDSTESVHTKENLPKETKQKKRRATQAGLCFDDWKQEMVANGIRPLPDDHAAFTYAEKIGLPAHFIRLGWLAFEQDHAENREKTQLSWPQTFTNYVRKGYLKIWFSKDGTWQLNTRGAQVEREYNADRSLTANDPGVGPRFSNPAFKGAK